MKWKFINVAMFFARGDILCNDTTELSVVELLSAAFVVPALKPQESRNFSETARSFGTDTER